MVAFIAGLLCGVVISIACFGAAFVLIIAGKVNRGEGESVKKQPESKDTMEFCRQQAQLQNFWTYDGTKQTNSEEIAHHLYDQMQVNRPPKKMP